MYITTRTLTKTQVNMVGPFFLLRLDLSAATFNGCGPNHSASSVLFGFMHTQCPNVTTIV